MLQKKSGHANGTAYDDANLYGLSNIRIRMAQ